MYVCVGIDIDNEIVTYKYAIYINFATANISIQIMYAFITLHIKWVAICESTKN